MFSWLRRQNYSIIFGQGLEILAIVVLSWIKASNSFTLVCLNLTKKMKAQQVLENYLEYRLNFLNQILSELKVLISLIHLSLQIEIYSVIFFQIHI